MLVLRAAAVLFCSDCLITSLKLKLEQKSQHFVPNFPRRPLTAVTADHAPSRGMMELAPSSTAACSCTSLYHPPGGSSSCPRAVMETVTDFQPDTEITTISISSMAGSGTGCGVVDTADRRDSRRRIRQRCFCSIQQFISRW